MAQRPLPTASRTAAEGNLLRNLPPSYSDRSISTVDSVLHTLPAAADKCRWVADASLNISRPG